MDNLILEKLGYREEKDAYGIKVTAFNGSTCMSVRVFMTGSELKAFGEECRDLLQNSLLHQWGEEEGNGDCLKLMARGSADGSAEGRLFMKAALRPDWADTACLSITASLGDFDAFGAAMSACMEGEEGAVLALCKDIRY